MMPILPRTKGLPVHLPVLACTLCLLGPTRREGYRLNLHFSVQAVVLGLPSVLVQPRFGQYVVGIPHHGQGFGQFVTSSRQANLDHSSVLLMRYAFLQTDTAFNASCRLAAAPIRRRAAWQIHSWLSTIQ